jgi:hypothetical protein
MIRTSCSVKPRVVIFHISATKEEIETQVRPCLRDESATTCLWFTTVNRVIVVSVYGGGSRLYFLERRALVLLEVERCLVSRVLEVFSAVEFGINRPHSGSDHRHCSSEESHYDCRQRMRRARQRYPDLDSCNRNSRDWRPEPKKEKYARDSRNQIREAGHQSSSFKEMRGSAIEQDRARQPALKQETSARPAFGECGKQTLQTRPPIAGLMLVILETGRKGQK